MCQIELASVNIDGYMDGLTEGGKEGERDYDHCPHFR